jgi:heme A synthase
MRTSALFVELFLVAYVCIFIDWLTYLSWFDPEPVGDDSAVSFNYHSLFMSLAFPILMTQSVLLYKGFGFTDRAAIKKTHGILHTLSFVFIVLGVIFIFSNHISKSIRPLYSVHSWIAVLTILSFFFQMFFGMWIFLFHSPDLAGDQWRERSSRYAPYHRFFGLTTYLLGMTTVLAGIQEKQGFISGSTAAGHCKWLSVLVALVAVFTAFTVSIPENAEERTDEHKVLLSA